MAIVQGTPGSETLNKSDGVTDSPDAIFGQGGNDTIFGFGGDDSIWGGEGADTIDGGFGSDTAMFSDSTAGVLLNLETGAGTYGTAAGDILISIENLYGSAFVDRLIGNGASNTLNGAGGNDILKGGGGTDQLFGGANDDILQGGAGADTLNGGDGIDTANYASSLLAINADLGGGGNWWGDAEGDTFSSIENITGSAHDDLIRGNAGSNVLSGQDGDDYLRGGAGADNLQGGAGWDTLGYYGSATAVTVSLHTGAAAGGDAAGDVFSGMENLQGSQHDDTLEGDAGRNSISGWDGDDTLRGLGGDDRLWGGVGADALFGGEGVDTADYNTSAEGVTVSLVINSGSHGDAEGDTLDGIENLFGSPLDDTLIGNNGANALDGAHGNDTLKGFGGADTLLGREEDDLLFGMDADDYLNGGEGNDTLNGGVGLDTMRGEAGNDTYVVDSAADVIVESAGQGIDTVRASVSYTLGAGVDIETFETTDEDGTAAINLTGNSSGNVVLGNDGNNVINGGDGNDELTGFGGEDAFLFNTPLSEEFNIDVITDFNVADDTIQLDDAIFSSSLGLGNISAGELVIGAAAQDANDRIIYDSNTGELFYDSDGVGATAAIQFAVLSPGLSLTYLDFLVV